MPVRPLLHASVFAAAVFLTPAVMAQTLAAGTTVTDPQGGEVGTITAVEGDVVVLRTDRHEVRLPAASFTATATGALFAVTRDQLNADLDRMQAQAAQAFAVGANVVDRNGVAVGPVTALDAESVTVRVGDGIVRLPRAALAAGQQGLVVGATLAEIQAAAVPAPAEAPASEAAPSA
jgi:hypothetical protein